MLTTVYTDSSLMNNTRDMFMETLKGTPGNCRATAAVILTEDPANPNLLVRYLRATTEDGSYFICNRTGGDQHSRADDWGRGYSTSMCH